MAHVLHVAAGELRNPRCVFVAVKTDDLSTHRAQRSRPVGRGTRRVCEACRSSVAAGTAWNSLEHPRWTGSTNRSEIQRSLPRSRRARAVHSGPVDPPTERNS